MSYDERLAERVRGELSRSRGVSERKMFGGLAFLLRGRMCCGVLGRDLVARVGAGAYAKALGRAHARPMDFTGRPLRGFVFVGPKGWARPASLRRWIEEAVRHARTLPAK